VTEVWQAVGALGAFIVAALATFVATTVWIVKAILERVPADVYEKRHEELANRIYALELWKARTGNGDGGG